ERAILALLVCYYGAYACYFALPALGPRFHLPALAAPPTGVVLAEPIRRLIDVLEPNKLDCFPSLHAAILFVTMAVARRETPPLFLALWRVAGTADRFPRLFGAAASDAASGLAPWLWQFGTFFWLFLALPLVHAMARRYALPAGPLLRPGDVVPFAGDAFTPAS